MKRFLVSLFIIGTTLFAVEAQKLTGTIIGTTNCYDYSTYSCSSTVNIPVNAFDGNIMSFFASCNGSGGWAGLDLGEPFVITEVAYCPRPGMPQNMLLGVFEGANKPDFGDAVPIYMITETPTDASLSRKQINCSKAFRYVRYVGPNEAKSNVAEIEFYGFKSLGDNSKSYQATNLPTVVIHTSNAEDIVSKDTYLKGIVSIISANGQNTFTDSIEIKGRGNASWNFPKKPYRFKLFHKASLLGMPAKAKDWTLINNYGDKTLIRNMLAFDLSKKLEMPYTPAGKLVDVFLNGEYKGTYQLCDQIEVGTGRIPIEEMPTTTTTLPDLSGGYFLEMDAYANEEISWFTSGRNYIPVTIKYPKDDKIIPVQRDYIINQFNTMENALYAANYNDLANGFRKYIDTETFLRHFLVGELTGNTDTYWSTYLYKFKNDDKFYVGPVWDFDIAYENDYRTFPINKNPEWIYNSTGSAAFGVKDLVNRIFTDPQVNIDLKKIYANYRDKYILSENSLLDVVNQYATEVDESQKLNFMRWNILNTKIHMNPRALGSYKAEVDSVKSFIKNRIIWMDNKLGYVPSAVNTVISPNIHYWVTDNTLHINGLSSKTNLSVIDVSGRYVAQLHVSNDFSIKLEKGIYIIRIIEDSSSQSMIKCLIQ